MFNYYYLILFPLVVEQSHSGGQSNSFEFDSANQDVRLGSKRLVYEQARLNEALTRSRLRYNN